MDPPVASTSSTPFCAQCQAQPSKYKCPRCALPTCSLLCSQSHKQVSGCSGLRDKAKKIELKDYGYGAMMDDYTWLEEGRRKVEAWGKEIGEKGLDKENITGAAGGDSGRGRGRGRGRGQNRGRGSGRENVRSTPYDPEQRQELRQSRGRGRGRGRGGRVEQDTGYRDRREIERKDETDHGAKAEEHQDSPMDGTNSISEAGPPLPPSSMQANVSLIHAANTTVIATTPISSALHIGTPSSSTSTKPIPEFTTRPLVPRIKKAPTDTSATSNTNSTTQTTANTNPAPSAPQVIKGLDLGYGSESDVN